jgi:glycosyltransferase involved in cell wall biosynthesis
MLVTLAESLEQQGCRCILGVFNDSRSPHVEVAEHARLRGLKVELVRCAGRCDLHAVTQIRRLIAKHRIDILHPHGYKADIYAYAAAWPDRVAIIATSHNWPNPLWSMRAYAVLDRWAMRSFDRIAVVSDLVADVLLRSGVEADKIRTIFNGVDCERFQSAEATLRNSVVSDNATLVGFIGRFVPDKGGEILLRAAQMVLTADPGARFVLVGDGPCREDWERLAVQLGIGKKVIFTGVRQDMPGIYASLDLFVLPSLCEAMPMCVLEAMAAGKAVIASRVGAITKVLVDKHTGMLVNPGNIEELAAAIRQLMRDPEQALRLGGNASTCAREQFSSEAMAKRYRHLYQEVIDSRQNANQTALALREEQHV